MSPAPGWYFGSHSTRELNDPLNPLGGFNILNPTSPMPSLSGSQAPQPAAGVSGTPAGRPPVESPTGGMTFGPPPEQGAADGSGPAASPGGPGFSVGEAADVANNGGSLSIGGFGPGTISTANMAAGLAGGLLGIPGTSIAMGPALAPFSLANFISDTAAKNMVDPASNTPVAQISPRAPADPQFAGSEGFAGTAAPAVGNPNTTIGRAIAAIQAMNNGPQPDQNTQGGFSGLGSNGTSVSPAGGIFSGLGAQTGNTAVTPTNTEIPDIAQQSLSPTLEVEDEGGPPGAPGGPASGPTGTVGDGTAGGIGGTAAGGEGGPGAPGGSGGDGVGGDGSGMRKGGKIQRPDPRRLAQMLKAGAKVPVGSKKPGQDDVPVNLSRGEEVVNRKATDKFGPVLDQMNAWGNRQGGFGVGQPGRPRMERR